MSKFNYLLLFLLIVSLNNVFAQEVETDSSIEEIVVTGSYLKTSPTDGASPIDELIETLSKTLEQILLLT